MKLNWMPGEVLGSGHFAFSGTLMHLKPWPLYNLMAAKLFTSQCNAIDRHPQFRARASALATSILAIPFRLSASRTATFEIYAIPVLLCRSRPFLGRKSATVSTVRIPATDPLLMLNFPSKPPSLKSSHPIYNLSLNGLSVTATRHVLMQPGGTENPESNPTNRSILKTRSTGNV